MASILSAGTSSGTALNLSGDTSGVLQLASNNGTVGLTMDTSQNVGIGTTSPSNKVEVTGAVKINAAANGTRSLYFGPSGGNYAAITYDDSAGSLALGTIYGYPLIFNTNNAERMRIDSSGNVGIGTSTIGTKLNVLLGTSYTIGSNWNTSVVTFGQAISSGGVAGGALGVSFDTTNGATLSSLNPGVSWYQMQLAGTYIAFRTGGSATEAMRIDGSGNVGIGTASPSANGKLTLSSASSSNYQTIIAGSVTSLVGTDSNGLALSALGANNVICYTLGTERMRIDSSGNLLVGTTTTQNAHINTVVDTTYDGIAITGNTSSSINAMAFRNTNGLIGRINLSGTATSFVTSSDYRLKENVAPMQNALNVVQQLKPVTYDWISTKEKGQGFIAHELQAVVPECVVGEKDAVDAEGKPVYQGIDTSFLVATLTAAIQEQQALITTLQTQVAAIQAKVGA